MDTDTDKGEDDGQDQDCLCSRLLVRGYGDCVSATYDLDHLK